MRAIVYQDTDETNVYGFVRVDVVESGQVVDVDLPKTIEDDLREQYPQTGCRSINRAEQDVVRKLQRLGYEVLDSDLEPHAARE